MDISQQYINIPENYFKDKIFYIREFYIFCERQLFTKHGRIQQILGL